MWPAVLQSVTGRFVSRALDEPTRLPVEPFTIELVELAKAVWLPHNTPTPAAVPSGSSARDPVVEGAIAGRVASPEALVGDPPASPSLEPLSSLPLPTSVSTISSASPESTSTEPGRSRYAFTEFMQAFVTPHEGILRAQQVYDPIVAMLQFLEQHGECPSLVVIAPERDHEAGELYPVRQALLRVTLKDHTFHVIDFALKILKETYRDYRPLIPKVLVAAIGHDLGKAPAFRTATVYTMGDHTAASAVQVQKCFQGRDISWLNEAINAIVAHHRGSNNALDVLLKQADERARQYELSQQEGGLSVQPFEQWCQIPELLQVVSLRVNVVKRSNTWEAVSYKDVVYIVPDVLLDAARQLAKKKGVVELGLIRADDREPMLRRLVGSLRTQHFLGEDVGEGYYGRFYHLVMAKRANTKRLYLIPVKKDAFGDVHTQFEGRKEGLLSLITDVRHVR